MKSAFLVGPQTIQIRDIADPVAPDDGLILTTKACGVCGSDLRRWREGPPKGADSLVQGHELSGTVIEVGKNVEGYAVGNRLAIAPDMRCGKCYYCHRGMYNLCPNLTMIGITPGINGGFAEKVLLSGQALANGIIHHMPNGLSFAEGALAETLASVLAAHHKAGTSLNDTVVIMGGGPIGCLHVSVSKARGARTIISEPSETRRQTVKRFEPDVIVDPFNEDLRAIVLDQTNGVGADTVICANPIAATQTEAVNIVRRAGRVVLFGGLPKSNPMTTMDANIIHYGEIVVVGAFSYLPIFHEEALKLLSRNIIPAGLMITHTFPLDDVSKAFEVSNAGESLKAIVVP